jgi:hypothetical protein
LLGRRLRLDTMAPSGKPKAKKSGRPPKGDARRAPAPAVLPAPGGTSAPPPPARPSPLTAGGDALPLANGPWPPALLPQLAANWPPPGGSPCGHGLPPWACRLPAYGWGGFGGARADSPAAMPYLGDCEAGTAGGPAAAADGAVNTAPPPPPAAAGGGGAARGGPRADSSAAGQHPADLEAGTAGGPAAAANGGEPSPDGQECLMGSVALPQPGTPLLPTPPPPNHPLIPGPFAQCASSPTWPRPAALDFSRIGFPYGASTQYVQLPPAYSHIVQFPYRDGTTEQYLFQQWGPGAGNVRQSVSSASNEVNSSCRQRKFRKLLTQDAAVQTRWVEMDERCAELTSSLSKETKRANQERARAEQERAKAEDERALRKVQAKRARDEANRADREARRAKTAETKAEQRRREAGAWRKKAERARDKVAVQRGGGGAPHPQGELLGLCYHAAAVLCFLTTTAPRPGDPHLPPQAISGPVVRHIPCMPACTARGGLPPLFDLLSLF